jgi:hypothetical protein
MKPGYVFHTRGIKFVDYVDKTVGTHGEFYAALTKALSPAVFSGRACARLEKMPGSSCG